MPPAIPQLLDSVSADEADLLISDEDAFHCEETNIVNSEVYSGRRKASINIDVIGASFSEGDVVSLNTLKEKKLISEKVGHIKILGRGRLNKPLTVIAQNFSASAVKMVVLTGGSAILAEGAPKRRK
jgi:ribosomal protein L15